MKNHHVLENLKPRPKKDDVLLIRLSNSEKQFLKKMASKNKLSLADYVRHAIYNYVKFEEAQGKE